MYVCVFLNPKPVPMIPDCCEPSENHIYFFQLENWYNQTVMKNYSDIIQTSWYLSSPATQLFIQQLMYINNIENIKSCALSEKSISDLAICVTRLPWVKKGQLCLKCFHVTTLSCYVTLSLMGGMPFVCESVVPHLSATLSERCTGERRALSTRRCSPQCLFYWEGGWRKLYKRLPAKNSLKNKLPILKL